jgi:hypothetical protein
MLIQQSHGIDEDKPISSRDAIWAQVESGSVSPIQKGWLLVWDLNDNRSALGQSTIGLRVVVCPAAELSNNLVRMAGFATTPVPASPPTAAGPGSRGNIFLAQCYGFFSGAFLDNTAGFAALAGEPLYPALSAAGKVQARVGANIGTIVHESFKVVGFLPSGVGAGTITTIDLFIRGII